MSAVSTPSPPTCLETLAASFVRAQTPLPEALKVIARAVDVPLQDPPGSNAIGAHDLRLAAEVAQAAPALPDLPLALRAEVFAPLVCRAIATGKAAVLNALVASPVDPGPECPVPGIQEQILIAQLRDPYWLDRLPDALFEQLKAVCAHDPVPIGDAVWQSTWERGGPWALDNDQQIPALVSTDQWAEWWGRQALPDLLASALAPVFDGRPAIRFPKSHIVQEQQEQLLFPPHASQAPDQLIALLATRPLPPPGSAGLEEQLLKNWAMWALERTQNRLDHPGTHAWKAWLAAPFAPENGLRFPIASLVDHWSAVMAWDSLFLSHTPEEAAPLSFLFSGRHLPALLELVEARSIGVDSPVATRMRESDLQVIDSLMAPAPGCAWRERLATVNSGRPAPASLVEEIRALYLAQRLDERLGPLGPEAAARAPRPRF